jgi:hypothetical protein
MVDVPETRYAHAEQGNIAFQVIGDGPISVVFVGDWWNHVEWQWGKSHTTPASSCAWLPSAG